MAKNKTVGIEDLLGSEDLQDSLKQVSFEHGMKLLQELVQTVESGSLPLDKSMLAYERGAQLSEQLRNVLGGAEEKLKVLQRGK